MAEETTQQATTQQTAATTTATTTAASETRGTAAATGTGTGTAATTATEQKQTSAATTTEQKTQQTSEGKTSTTADDKKTAAAELEIVLPKDVKIDQATLDGFKSIAKEHGLSQKQAQALVDFQLKRTQEQQASSDKSYAEALQRQRVTDLDAIKADPKLGGANFDKTVQEYRAAVQKFGGEDLRKMLEASGYDCHPAVVRTFVAIAQRVAEDQTAGNLTQTSADVKARPMSQTERMAGRYARKSA